MHRTQHTWPATPQHVGDARACVAAFAAGLGVPATTIDGVRLAVSEAVTNVVVHGYRDHATGSVTVIAEAEDGHLIVSVLDEGGGLLPRPDSPGAGLGLPLIAELTGSLSVSQASGGHGTVLRMTFDLPFAVAG